MGLKEYKAKRNFGETAEPEGKVGKPRRQGELMFVIQKHDASRLHYDLRLELDGVLISWAVPKGLPYQRGVKHLAVHVEDHPMSYAHFEGTIPEGNYGGGTVMVWDTGTYTVEGTDPARGLSDGKFHFILKGKKVQGEWAMIRLRPRPGEKGENWLLFKSKEDHRPISAKEDDKSVLTRRSLKKIAEDNDRQWESNRHSDDTTKARKSPSPKKKEPARARQSANKSPSQALKYLEPMKCRLVEETPSGGSWIYELKFDGVRALGLKNAGQLELYSRAQLPLDVKYPEAVEGMKNLPCHSCILDGEVVALDDQGRSSFQLLQQAGTRADRPPIFYYVFDLLYLDRESLVERPVEERKAALKKLVGRGEGTIRFSSSLEGDPGTLLKKVKDLGLEGIIAKKKGSPYQPGRRSGDWLKVKLVSDQEFVIGGFSPPQGSRQYFGALLVGYFEKGQLKFASKVGTGFSSASLKSLHRLLQALKITECPFSNLPEKKIGRGGLGGGGNAPLHLGET